MELEKSEARRRSHMRWNSKRRTLHLKRRARAQKVLFSVVGVALSLTLFGGATSFFSENEASIIPVEGSSQTPSYVPSRVNIVIEGKETQTLSVAQTMDEFMKEQSLIGLVPMQDRFDRADFTEKRSAPALEFRYPKIINVSVDNSNRTILTNGITVYDALKENGIVVDGDDIVSVSLQESAKGLSSISITRVTTSTRTAEEVIQFSTIKQNDSSLAKGKTVVKQEGQNGVASVTYTQSIKDGVLSSEVVTYKTVVKAPVDKIIRVGTKPLGTESGKASWYAHIPGTCAHKTLPMGTIVTVRNSNTGATTTCRVADRGPFAPGRVVDLSKDVFSKIASTSQGVVPVTISW